MDCWLSFRVVEPGGDVRVPFVRDVHAVRSGRGGHEGDTYIWNDSERMWVTAPEDDGEACSSTIYGADALTSDLRGY